MISPCVSVRGLSAIPSHHADLPMLSQGRLPEVLRQNHPSGCRPTLPSSTLCYLPRKGPQASADVGPVQRRQLHGVHADSTRQASPDAKPLLLTKVT